MSKLVHIHDVKPIEVFIGRKTRGPITQLMDESTIHRLLHLHDGPKDIFAVNPKTKKEVRLTTKNYTLSIEELFADVDKKEEVKKEASVYTDKERDEALNRALNSFAEPKAPEINKPVPIEETKVTETVIENMTDTLKDDNGKEVEVPAGDVTDKPSEIIPENQETKDAPVIENKPSDRAKQYYNKRYTKNN